MSQRKPARNGGSVLKLDTVTTAAVGILSLAAEGASPVAHGTDFAMVLRRRAPPA